MFLSSRSRRLCFCCCSFALLLALCSCLWTLSSTANVKDTALRDVLQLLRFHCWWCWNIDWLGQSINPGHCLPHGAPFDSLVHMDVVFHRCGAFRIWPRNFCKSLSRFRRLITCVLSVCPVSMVTMKFWRRWKWCGKFDRSRKLQFCSVQISKNGRSAFKTC